MKTGLQQTSFLPDFCGTRIVFVVIIVAELLAIVLTLAQPPYVTNRLFELAVYSLFIQWVALSCVAVLCLCRPYLNRLKDVWVATLSYAITLIVSLIITEIAWWLFAVWPTIEDSNLHYGHGIFLGRNMGISAIACALALRYFYVQHQWRHRIRLEAEARFQALQSRIRPHFLFNCMNTIASLTQQQPELAEQAIEDLSDLFRVSLNNEQQLSTVGDELDLCERYLRIEKHRLGERLSVNWQVEHLPKDIKLPALLLQPMLENAIYHGIEQLPAGGTIHFSGEIDKKTLIFTIENPVPAYQTNDTHSAGHNLAQENINQRLKTFYDQTDLLKVTSDRKHYRVRLTIPYMHETINS